SLLANLQTPAFAICRSRRVTMRAAQNFHKLLMPLNRFYRRVATLMAVLVIAASLSGCGVNNIPRLDEQVKAAWSQVLNQYKRRADLIPNLVSTVKGYAKHEREVLTAVTKARSRVGSIQAPQNVAKDPAAFKKFMQAQQQLSGALSRLLVVSERYPKLKASQNFLT